MKKPCTVFCYWGIKVMLWQEMERNGNLCAWPVHKKKRWHKPNTIIITLPKGVGKTVV